MPEDWRKAHVSPIFNNRKKDDPEATGQSASPPSLGRKVMEQLILETISRHVKDTKSSDVVSMASPRGSQA